MLESDDEDNDDYNDDEKADKMTRITIACQKKK